MLGGIPLNLGGQKPSLGFSMSSLDNKFRLNDNLSNGWYSFLLLNAYISWVENQSDQYGTQSLGFGGFGGLLVSGLMFSIVCCCKNKPPFYLARKAENPLLFCGAYSELFSRFDSKPNAVGKSSQLGKISDPLLWKNKCGESCKPWKMSD